MAASDFGGSVSRSFSMLVLSVTVGCGTLDATDDSREVSDVGDLAWQYSEDACPEPEEMSDAMADAVRIGEGVNRSFSINHVHDVDYYFFEVPPHQRAFLETGTSGVEFRFYDGGDLFGSALPEHGVVNGGDEPMVVLVEVTGDEDCVDYYLNLYFVECRSEDVLEPNDAPHEATPLHRGGTVDSLLTGDNPVDLFAFDPVLPGEEMFAYLVVEDELYVDMDLVVTTESGAYLGGSFGDERLETVRWTNEGVEPVTPIVEVYMYDFFGPDQCVQAEYMLADFGQ